jgi:hypothetical protein
MSAAVGWARAGVLNPKPTTAAAHAIHDLVTFPSCPESASKPVLAA